MMVGQSLGTLVVSNCGELSRKPLSFTSMILPNPDIMDTLQSRWTTSRGRVQVSGAPRPSHQPVPPARSLSEPHEAAVSQASHTCLPVRDLEQIELPPSLS